MLAGFNTQLVLKVDWADLDLFGHVNNVIFFKYIQSARVNYCESIGLTSLDEKDKLSFIVAAINCNFKSPLRYPNTIIVFSKIEWIKNSSFQLTHIIVDQNKCVVAEASDVIVVFDYVKKSKANITSSIKEQMELLENRKL